MASGLEVDLYSILEIKPDATKDEIKESYRRLALQRHPDKNPGDVDACVAFQKLIEAYDTLYDENRRMLYDAKFYFLRPGFSKAQNETPSAKDEETSLRESLKTEQEEREWEERDRVATENITRLKMEIGIIRAKIRLERKTYQKKISDSWDGISSTGTALETTEEKGKRLREEQNQLLALRLAQTDLVGFNNEKENLHMKRSGARFQAEQDQDNGVPEAMAWEVEQEEAQAATRRAAQEEELKAQEAGEKEGAKQQKAADIQEQDLREQLRRKEAAPRRKTKRGRRRSAKAKLQTGCAHRRKWSKVKGGNQCSACFKTSPSRIFQCDGCGLEACNDWCRMRLIG